jgi:hypothetical protein
MEMSRTERHTGDGKNINPCQDVLCDITPSEGEARSLVSIAEAAEKELASSEQALPAHGGQRKGGRS